MHWSELQATCPRLRSPCWCRRIRLCHSRFSVQAAEFLVCGCDWACGKQKEPGGRGRGGVLIETFWWPAAYPSNFLHPLQFSRRLASRVRRDKRRIIHGLHEARARAWFILEISAPPRSWRLAGAWSELPSEGSFVVSILCVAPFLGTAVWPSKKSSQAAVTCQALCSTQSLHRGERWLSGDTSRQCVLQAPA